MTHFGEAGHKREALLYRESVIVERGGFIAARRVTYPSHENLLLRYADSVHRKKIRQPEV